VVVGAAVALLAPVAPAQAVAPAAAPAVTPVALDTCRNPGNAFVSLEIAPEVTGPAPIGAGYHRLWDMAVAWRDVNPSPGVFVWTTLDQRVAQAEASGSIPMMVLGLTPQWAAKDPNAGDPRWGAGTASPPSDINAFRTYVDAIVSRYGGRIGAYEVWNEANLQTFWTGTPAEMAQMTQVAYPTIQATNPGAVVTSASVTTRLRSPMARFMTPYAQALRDLGFPLDAWAIHTYPAGNAGPPERKADVKNWQQVVATAIGAGSPGLDKQVWDTEVNYGLAGPGSTPPTDYSDAQGADLITQTFADSLELGIDATFWYLYTAAPFDLLGVQLWAGTPLSIAAWNAARAKYNGGANLCAGSSGGSGASGGSGSGGTSGGSTATSVTLAPCTRDASGKRIVLAGTSTGAAGQGYTVFLRVGRGAFKPLGQGVVASDGTINFVRATTRNRAVTAYVQVGSTKSNRVNCPS
jgi:hypothetical protein